LQALSHLGVPYRFGGNDPKAGFDCSGLVRFVARSVLGIDLPRTSDAMARVGSVVARDALEVGDLLFFNTRGGANSHVGIYVGDGRFVHASSVLRKVTENSLSESYYQKTFNGIRRVAGFDSANDVPAIAE
jgi:cell wall-associated NlpC family hydrolase